MFGSQIQILTREKEKAKDEKVSDANKIYELLKIPKLKLGDRLANVLGTEGEKILEDNLLQAKELEDKNIEQIKEEYEFDKIKDVFDKRTVSPQLDFFSMVGVVCQRILNTSVIFYCLMMKILDFLILFAWIKFKIL